jgi:hypothetical protein
MMAVKTVFLKVGLSVDAKAVKKAVGTAVAWAATLVY